MKAVIIIFILMACSFNTSAQDINPYEGIGKKGKIITLSNGKYTEVHINDSLQRIGSVIVNMNTGTIHKLLDMDSLYSETALDPTLVGRFYALDPLAGEYPHNSPYAFSENRLIDSKELEGLERLDTKSINDGTFKPVFKIRLPNDDIVQIYESIHGGKAITDGDRRKIKSFIHDGFQIDKDNNTTSTNKVSDNGDSFSVNLYSGGVTQDLKDGVFSTYNIQGPSVINPLQSKDIGVGHYMVGGSPELVPFQRQAANIMKRNVNRGLEGILSDDPNIKLESVTVKYNPSLMSDEVLDEIKTFKNEIETKYKGVKFIIKTTEDRVVLERNIEVKYRSGTSKKTITP